MYYCPVINIFFSVIYKFKIDQNSRRWQPTNRRRQRAQQRMVRSCYLRVWRISKLYLFLDTHQWISQYPRGFLWLLTLESSMNQRPSWTKIWNKVCKYWTFSFNLTFETPLMPLSDSLEFAWNKLASLSLTFLWNPWWLINASSLYFSTVVNKATFEKL